MERTPKRGHRDLKEDSELAKLLQHQWIDVCKDRVKMTHVIGRHRCSVGKRPRIKMHISPIRLTQFVYNFAKTQAGAEVLQFYHLKDGVYRVMFDRPFMNHTTYEIELEPQTKPTSQGFQQMTDEMDSIQKQLQTLSISHSCTLHPIHYMHVRDHTCIVEICPFRQQHEALNEFSTQLTFICESSGKVHFCGELCDRQVQNSEHIMICELSGLAMSNQGENAPEPFFSNKTLNPFTFTSFNRLSESLSTDGDIFLPSLQPRNVNIKLKGVHGYFSHTFNEVSRCFSDDRVRADDVYNKRQNEKKAETLRKQIERDKKQNAVTSVSALLSEAHKFDLINTSHLPMLLDDNAKRETIERLSWKCMKLWYIIHVHILPNTHNPPVIPTAFPVSENLPLPPSAANFHFTPPPPAPEPLHPSLSTPQAPSFEFSFPSSGSSSFSEGSGFSGGSAFSGPSPPLSSSSPQPSLSLPSTPHHKIHKLRSASASAPPTIRVFPTTSKRRTPYIFGTNYTLFILGALKVLAEGISFIELTGDEIVLVEPEDILKIYPPWVDSAVAKNTRRDPNKQRQAIYEAIKKCFSDASRLTTLDRTLLMLTDIRIFPDESIFN